MMNQRGTSDSNILRLYQVTFAEWGPPVCVVASDFKQAADIASRSRESDHNARSMFVWDMTDDWKGVSIVMHGHTKELLNMGIVGIATYDEELGWSVSNVEMEKED